MASSGDVAESSHAWPCNHMMEVTGFVVEVAVDVVAVDEVPDVTVEVVNEVVVCVDVVTVDVVTVDVVAVNVVRVVVVAVLVKVRVDSVIVVGLNPSSSGDGIVEAFS
mmetsp:Transcript_31126/g.78873  ORF Transcript_31126/g.78873 Transcript_31126/m.78873 type:complete len:108 (+) Transcript_31126:754-1077(+)